MSKVLVVANQTLAREEISEFVKSRMGEEPPEFTLPVPATARTPHWEQAARLLGTISGGHAQGRRCPPRRGCRRL